MQRKSVFKMNVKGGLLLMFIGSVLSAWDWRFAAISFGTLLVTYQVRESMKEQQQKKPISDGNR
ncbi:hypothetical protein D920_02049 [Enterococcus faecalis 13-SD-W-01]|nr:hypothetical protein D920_02049 [Enterococcus faecalis 13-SD-W-01]